MARPKLDIDPNEVYRLATIQCTAREIAIFFECDESTIKKRFSHEIKKGHEYGKMSIRRKQFQIMETGHAAMAIWMGKQYLGQRDQPDMTVDEISAKMAEVLKKLEDAAS